MLGRTDGPKGRWAHASAACILLLALAIHPLLVIGQDDGGYASHDPIAIMGDEELDEMFKGSGMDGLSWETAYLIEGYDIRSTGRTPAVLVQNTSRYLMVRKCRMETGWAQGNKCLYLKSTAHVRVEDCTLMGTERAIRVLNSYDVTIHGNDIENHTEEGVSANDCENLTVTENELHESGIAISVRNSVNVTVRSNRAWSGKAGIELFRCSGSTVTDNEVWENTVDGLHIKQSEDVEVNRNEARWNWNYGLNMGSCADLRVEDNLFEDNRGGVHLDSCDGIVLSRNDITDNGYRGIRLTGSGDNSVEGNTIRSNGAIGIDFVGSGDNEVVGNDIMGHSRAGISLLDSLGNVIEGNRIYNNWWVAIEGNTDGNTIRDNDLRANSWVRVVLFLVVGIIAIGVASGFFIWARRRSRKDAEKGKVVVKRRFPPGERGLWTISKWLWDEDFFQAQIESAGPQREQILERYESNIAAAKQMQYFTVGTMAVMLVFLAILPLVGVYNMVVTDVTEETANDVLFATSISVGLYFLMSFVILLVFGLLFLAQLMKGSIFQLLATLPFDRRSSRRVVFYMLLRMYGAPFIVVLLAFPIGGFIITLSFAFLASSLLVNGLNLLFVSFLLILISDVISRRVFSASATRGATVMRFVVMGGYLISMMTVFIAIQFLVAYVADLYESAKLSGGSGEAVNSVISIIPFPFSGGYLVAISLTPISEVPVPVLITTILGILILAGAIYAMRRSVNRILARVAMGQEMTGVGPGQLATEEDIRVRAHPPIRAHAKNNLLVTSRDMGAIIYLIMPLIFPFIVIMSMLADPDVGTFAPIFPYVMYIGITPFMVNMALSTSDANMGGLLASLPFRVRDQFRAKQIVMTLVMLIPLTVIALIMAPRVDEPSLFLMLMFAFAPTTVAISTLYLITFSMAFGQVNNRYTFFMTSIRYKLAKYVGIIAFQYLIVTVLLGVFWALYAPGHISFGDGIAGIVGASVLLIIVGEAAARRLFP